MGPCCCGVGGNVATGGAVVGVRVTGGLETGAAVTGAELLGGLVIGTGEALVGAGVTNSNVLLMPMVQTAGSS